MKVIFLDMDGVLCTARSHAAYHGPGGCWAHLDPVATKLVVRLCDETGAQLVLSSTWRQFHNQDAMTAILKGAGFEEVPWHKEWKTPSRMSICSRGSEIKLWLQDNTVDSYLIIDDDDDFTDEQRPFHVHTHAMDGMGFEHYQDARRILGVA